MPVPFSSPEKTDQLGTNPAGFVKDVYLTFLQDYFAALPQGRFRYTGSDTPESELEIIDQSTVHKEVIEKRPAIILQRSPLSWSRIGLDQLQFHDLRTDLRRHTDLLTGTMVLHCMAKRGLEAERLASETLLALKFHRRELQRRGIFDGGQEAQMGSESTPGAIVGGDVDPHAVDVPVISPFYLQMTWESRPSREVKVRGFSVRLSPVHRTHKRLGGRQVIDLDGVSQDVRIRQG